VGRLTTQVIDFTKTQKRQNRSFRRFEVHGGYAGYEFFSSDQSVAADQNRQLQIRELQEFAANQGWEIGERNGFRQSAIKRRSPLAMLCALFVVVALLAAQVAPVRTQ
jgi:hypothetical protein